MFNFWSFLSTFLTYLFNQFVNQETTIKKVIIKKIKENFINIEKNAIIIHLDTKILENITGKKVTIIATSHTVDKHLGVLEIFAGTGLKIFSIVYEVIQNWGITNSIQAFVFGTTASNSGQFNGANYLLERKIKQYNLGF